METDRSIAASSPLVACLVLVASAGCTGKAEREPPPPPPVEAVRAAVETVPIQIHTIGTAEAIAEVEIRSQVGGKLIGIDFEEGDEVMPGDPLFRLDPRPFEDALDSARAALRRSQAQARFAAEEAERFEKLVQRGATSEQLVEERRTAAAAARATVAADEALVRDAETNLGFTRITAPIQGKTGSLLVHIGDQIPANGDAMVSLRQISPIYVNFSVNGDRLAAIRSAQGNGSLEVLAAPRGSPDQVHLGELTFVDNLVDPATGMILLKGTFANEDELLWPGLFVELTLVLGMREGAVVVPSAAVQSGQQGEYVFVVDDQLIANPVPVKPGERHGDRIVIEEGLRGGERVVTDGQLRLKPGTAVSLQPPRPGTGAPQP